MATIVDRSRGERLRDALQRLRTASVFRLSGNEDRRVLWIPVAFGCGIAAYFALPAEPDFPTALGLLAISAAGFLAVRLYAPAASVAVMAVMIALAGFTTAQYRTMSVEAPVLARDTGPVYVTARVRAIEPTRKGARFTLADPRFERRVARPWPEIVRVHVRNDTTGIQPGDTVRLRAILGPPSEPALPGGFDFARKAYFERIGAVGFALGDVERLSPPPDLSAGVRVSRLRHDLTRKILAASDPAIGPVAAALLTGERRAIPEPVLANMRDSGLAHLLAISGLHIGLVAGLIFFAVRLMLASIERVALRYPIKKIAAVTAIVGAFAYLVISGATIPTQRAFLMVSIVMAAVLLDRTAISLRLVALAAGLILLVSPEALLSASFQMSFAAVIALVAAYEFAAPRTARLRQRGGIYTSRLAMFVAATLLTTVVASLATAPFAVYHFNRVALFGLAANMLAVPVMAMWIMPTGVLSMLLMPLGLEAWGLTLMGWGLKAVLAVAGFVAGLPDAVALVPPMPAVVLAAMVLGGLWLCIWRGRIRLLGVPVLAAAVFAAGFAQMPHVLVDRDARFFALNMGDGRVYMPGGRGASFERDMWRRRLAVSETRPLPLGVAENGRLGCDGAACIARFGMRSVVVIYDASASVDCRNVDHVILLVRASPRYCRRGRVLLSTFNLWRDGAHALRFTAEGPTVRTAREERGDRPWSRLSPRKRQYLRTSPTSRP